MSREPVQRLGRGLAALLGDAQGVVTDLSLLSLDANLLDPNPFQPRGAIDPASLAELTQSIRVQGLLQPLLVRRDATSPGRFQIVAGERRWRAAKAAGLTTVPCLVQKLTDQQSSAAALVENLQRLDLNGMEEATGYDRLLAEFSLTQEALADIVGKSRSHVANTLRLLKLPDAVQQLVRTGILTPGHARAVIGHPDPVAAAAHITSRGLSVRQAEDLAARAAEPRTRPENEPENPDIEAVQQDLAERLGVGVRLRARGGQGSLTLRFSTLDQLDFLIGRLGGDSK